MLVLSRKIDEKIIIDDRIEITVVELENGRVRLGIEAPQNMEIVRGELYSEVEQENIKAIKKAIGNFDELRKLKGEFKKGE
ncbi:MAG TPA: carbon storage regulator CsrA [Halanaerobiales bacterium]|nr:carbon storage regulator CsrA [Halanaerobiales bacterium]